MATVAERLHQLMGDRSKAAFARLCGIKESSLRQYLDGTSLPSLDNLVAISRATGASIDWIATGSTSNSSAFLDAETYEIPALRDRASAGSGLIATGELEGIRIPRQILDRLGLRPEHARVLRSSGSSMVPTIGDGDLLIADVTKSARSDLVDGKIYVFTISDGLFVKRLRRSARGWMMVSDNRDYPEEPIPDDVPVVIHGRIVWTDRSL